MLYYNNNMTLAFTHHDHKHCKHTQLANVTKICETRGLKFTPIRKATLSFLLNAHQAMGAYELLTLMARSGENAQPPLVYRALAFLTRNGFAHKIERLNAFVACLYPDEAHKAGFLICRECKQVGECCIDISPLAIEGFHVESEVFEAEGLCQNCHGET